METPNIDIDIEKNLEKAKPFFTKTYVSGAFAVMFVAGFLLNWMWLATFGLTALACIGLMALLISVVNLNNVHIVAIGTLSVGVFVSWWSGASFAFFAGSIIGTLAWWYLLHNAPEEGASDAKPSTTANADSADGDTKTE